MTWTPEMEQQLRDLIAQNWNPLRVASAMNLTRNQIVGKAYRLGIAFKRTDPPRRQTLASAGNLTLYGTPDWEDALSETSRIVG